MRDGAKMTGGSYCLLDLTALGCQEEWEKPKGRRRRRTGLSARLLKLSGPI